MDQLMLKSEGPFADLMREFLEKQRQKSESKEKEDLIENLTGKSPLREYPKELHSTSFGSSHYSESIQSPKYFSRQVN